MCKKPLRGDQKMNGETLVNEARDFAKVLIDREYSGPGQMERAMERASQKTGIDYSTFWSLRYRPPKDILASVYFRLRAAYSDECARQERLYCLERGITRAINNETDTAIVRAADFVAGQKRKEVN